MDQWIQELHASGNKIRLSHSTRGTLHGCERKFQLERILTNPNEREDWPATVFGKAFGHAAQHYFVLRTNGVSPAEALDSSMFQIFMAYTPWLEDDRRFMARCLGLFNNSQYFLEDRLLEYRIATFNGKPATELSFRLDIDDTYYYVGYIDFVLQHIGTGRFGVVDCKTTSVWRTDLDPYYKNSDQVLGYTVALDEIVGSNLAEFDTTYWAFQLANNEKDYFVANPHNLVYKKTLKDRLEWFVGLKLDIEHLQICTDMNIFPRRGDFCMAFNKPCAYFNECQFTSTDILRPVEKFKDDIVYDFTFQLDDIISSHVQRLAGR